VSETGFKTKEATLQFIPKQVIELRKHMRDLCASVRAEKCVIQDGMKDDVSAVKNDEDKIENSISSVSACQEELKNDKQLAHWALLDSL
jgi:hypothetical protein